MVESAGAAGMARLRWIGMTLAALMVVGFFGLAFLFIWSAEQAQIGQRCAANLKQIGTACQAYAAGHRQTWPCPFQAESERWDQVGNARTDRWGAVEHASEWGSPPPGAAGDNGEPIRSNTAALWMLLTSGLVENAGVFICPRAGDQYTVDDDVTDATNSPVRDFRGERFCSYSFQNVLPGATGYKLTSGSSPSMAVAADANPMRRDFWSGAPGGGVKNGVTDKMLVSKPTGEVPDWKGKITGPWDLNSPNHNFKGQNVLYMDGHVEFASSPFWGAGYDNIWLRRLPDVSAVPNPDDVTTLQASSDTASYDGKSTLPAKDRTDSFLVP
jgi:prepilin-type processing-associated H-X9-DG protein